MKRKKHEVSPEEFAKTERDPASLTDVESVVRQVLSHEAKPEKKSLNQQPPRAELRKPWRLLRRG